MLTFNQMNVHSLEEKREESRKLSFVAFIMQNRKRKHYWNIKREIILELNKNKNY